MNTLIDKYGIKKKYQDMLGKLDQSEETHFSETGTFAKN